LKENNLAQAKKTKVELYTDGACSGNPGVGGWAAILVYGPAEKELVGAVGQTTNNRMEMTAVIEGLKALKHPCNVTIYSDSAYIVNAIRQNWLVNWKKKGWLNASKQPVANRDLWEELDRLMGIHDTTFIKVKGHSDHDYNNRCDALAVAAVDRYKKEHNL
jgi:ribonuclease HI